MLLQHVTLVILIVCAALLAVPLATENRVFACTCAAPRPASELYQSSDVVFVGKAADIMNKDHNNIVQFEVNMAWKGVSDNAVMVRTADSGSMCGYGFEQGRGYLVYAHNGSEYLETGLCNGTQPFEGAFQDLAYLGPGYVPTPGQQIEEREPVGSLLIGLLAGAAVAGTIAFVALKKRKHEG